MRTRGQAVRASVVVGLALVGLSAPAPQDANGRDADVRTQLAALARTNAEARDALASGDAERAQNAAVIGIGIAPDNEYQLGLLARAEALAGSLRAMATLWKVLALGTAPDTSPREFDSLRARQDFGEVVARGTQLATAVVGRSRVVTTLPDRDLITEAVAFDRTTGDLFVSAAYRRAVLRLRRRSTGDGDQWHTVGLVGGPEGTLLGPTGLYLESARRRLWVCTSARPHMRGGTPDEPRRGGLVALDVTTNLEVRRVALADGAAGHACDSVVGSVDGSIYVSDPIAGAVWHLRSAGQALEPLVPAGLLPSPQDLAICGPEDTLFVADYARGVLRVDRLTGSLVWLDAPPRVSVVGIDGLECLEREGQTHLIAIQNGVRPHRIADFTLNATRTRITAGRVIAQNIAGWDEPTLGDVVGDTLIYVGRSQWRHVDATGRLNVDALQEPAIYAVDLAPASTPACGAGCLAAATTTALDEARGDVAVRAARRLVARVPDVPSAWTLLARALALDDRATEAFDAWAHAARLGSTDDISTERGVRSATAGTKVRTVQSVLERNRAPVVLGRPAWTLDDVDLLPESLAYDPVRGRWLIGSLNKRAVFELGSDGSTRPFIADPRMLRVVGMHFDHAAHHLWVATWAPIERGTAIAPRSGSQTRVFRCDAASGQVLDVYEPDDDRDHLFNDFVVTGQGDLLLTDTDEGAIYRLPAGSSRFERFLPPDAARLTAPNGIALAPDETTVFVAYLEGIVRIDLKSQAWRYLRRPVSGTTATVDGLYYHRGSLLAVQHRPGLEQVSRAWLDRSHQTITRIDVLERGPSLRLPTTGAVVGDRFYYIARSHYDRLSGERLTPLVDGPGVKATVRVVDLGGSPAPGGPR